VVNVNILTMSNQEYIFDSDRIVVRKNGLLFDMEDGDMFLPWANIKLVGTDSDDEEAVRDFFYNF
jgi:hypothetical protein